MATTTQIDLKNWREVGLAIQRSKAIDAGKLFSSIEELYESEAGTEAAKQIKAVTENSGSDWVDEFNLWSDQFGKSNAAAPAMMAWQALQNEHTEPAAEAMKAARTAFREQQTALGYQHYEEIATKYFAAPTYRQVRESLKNRK